MPDIRILPARRHRCKVTIELLDIHLPGLLEYGCNLHLFRCRFVPQWGTGPQRRKEGEQMKVAICSSENSLDSMVDPRFGRCPCFAVVDPETMENHICFKSRRRHGPRGRNSGRPGGCRYRRHVRGCGNIGPNAFAALSAAGIRMFAAVLGTVRAVLDQYLAGSLAEITGPTVAAHNGMGAGPQAGIGPTAGPGQGLGLGRGLGRGMGLGRGGGMGQGRGNGRGRGSGGRRGRAS